MVGVLVVVIEGRYGICLYGKVGVVLLCCKHILFPCQRVVYDVFCDSIMVGIFLDNMLIKIALPDAFVKRWEGAVFDHL